MINAVVTPEMAKTLSGKPLYSFCSVKLREDTLPGALLNDQLLEQQGIEAFSLNQAEQYSLFSFLNLSNSSLFSHPFGVVELFARFSSLLRIRVPQTGPPTENRSAQNCGAFQPGAIRLFFHAGIHADFTRDPDRCRRRDFIYLWIFIP